MAYQWVIFEDTYKADEVLPLLNTLYDLYQ
jgi:hypothetical protein